MRFPPTPWFVAGVGFVVLGFSRGLHSSFGVFNVALLDNFGWSRGATAGIFSIVLSVDALLSPLAGHLLDRYGTPYFWRFRMFVSGLLRSARSPAMMSGCGGALEIERRLSSLEGVQRSW
ncbi:MAG TPA: hypothetical protein VLA73_03305 [Burkholderiales bacterium]|nr:hypothetical protein [Burkholderiales bacterium]